MRPTQFSSASEFYNMKIICDYLPYTFVQSHHGLYILFIIIPSGRMLAKLLAPKFVSVVIFTALKGNLSLQLGFWSIFHLQFKPFNKRLLSLTHFSLSGSLLILHTWLGLNTNVSLFPSRRSLVVAEHHVIIPSGNPGYPK